MKPTYILAATGLAITVSTGAAAAQSQPQVSFNLGVTSDYRFRGVSQTANDPAVQGGADLTSGLLYAGTWASNVDFGGPTHAEVDVYAGVRPAFAGLTFDIGAIGYLYPGQASGAHEDYFEARIGASRPIGPATVGGAVAWSPAFFGGTGDAIYYELNAAYRLSPRWSASGAVGRQDVSYAGDYTTWNAGVTFQATPRIALDVRYVDTDGHAFGKPYDSAVLASLKTTF
jgi:uncharacterized protein (TIGR02001 family)